MSDPTTTQTATQRVTGVELASLLAGAKSIAFVGASSRPGSYGNRPVVYTKSYGYQGEIVLVNPNHDMIEGLPCIRSVTDIAQGSVDVAMVTVPAPLVPDAIDQLAEVGVKAAIVIAGEMTLEQKGRLAATAASSSMRIIGPNCIGVLSSRASAYLAFSRLIGAGRPRPGSIALITQSGAMGNSLLLSLLRRGAGIGHWVTSGEEIDVGCLELVAGYLRQDDVSGVGVFLEGIGDLEWLPAVAAAISETGKPVYVVKGAQTDAGRFAAAGHTGRVVGAAEASLAVIREAGLLDLPSMSALADVLIALDVVGPVPGNRVGIISLSGGAGVLAADSVQRSSTLELADLAGDAELAGRTTDRVHAVTNPLDAPENTDSVFAGWVNAIAASSACDGLIAVSAGFVHDLSNLADLVLASDRKAKVLLTTVSEEDRIDRAVIEKLAAGGIAVVPTPERAVAVLDALPKAGRPKAAPADDHDEGPSQVLGFEAAVALLGEDLPWVPYAAVETAAQALAAAVELGFPLVMKVAGRTIEHRTETGGVIVGVTQDSLAESFATVERIAAKENDGVLLQKFVPGGVEVMVSAVHDRELGAVAYIRRGGIFTELMHDQVVIWGGWSATQQRAALESSVVGQSLLGYRGGAHYDVDALLQLVATLLARLEGGVVDFVEFNPVMVRTDGLAIVDALTRRSV